jgi:hypothetical protein
MDERKQCLARRIGREEVLYSSVHQIQYNLEQSGAGGI